MNTPELLCDFKTIKADYRLADRCFRIGVGPREHELHFDIPVNDGEVFAGELEALAEIIRARVVRARLVANA